MLKQNESGGIVCTLQKAFHLDPMGTEDARGTYVLTCIEGC